MQQLSALHLTVEKRSLVGHPIHSGHVAPMSINRIFALATLVLLFSFHPSRANPPSYLEIADAPIISVDWSQAKAQSVTLGGNHTFKFSNAEKGGRYLLVVRQDETGSRNAKWPDTVHFPGGGPMIFTSTANKADYIEFFYNGVSYDVIGIVQNL
jgi:hypothetical protein